MVIITDLLLVKRLKFVYPSIDFVARWIDDQRTRAPHVLVDQPRSTQHTFCPPVNCSRDRERRGEMDLSMFPWRASGRRTRGFLLGVMPARVRRSPARRVGRQARGHLLRATRARGLPAPLMAPTPFCCDLPAPLILLPKPTRPAPIPHSGNRLDGSFSSNPSSNRPPRSVRLHGGR